MGVTTAAQNAWPSQVPQLKRRKTDNLPRTLIDNARLTQRISFDASKHLAFTPPKKISTFADIDQPSTGISEHAISDPFPLFTQEAIEQMRAEIFSEDVLDNHYCPTSETSGQVRGHCPRDAPFIYNAWNSPEILKIISGVAGVDLVPAVDYDIGQANISTPPKDADTTLEKIAAPGEAKSPMDGETSEFCESAFGWHRDTYPFVVVTMLSDCTGMEGGETAIRTGSGKVIKARGPSLGTAVVMQGRYVDHRATAALGGHERISMVTSFRPRDINTKDESVLKGVRNISHIPTLYYQYSSYRLENLEDRVREQARLVRKRQRANADYDIKQMRDWVEKQKAYLDTLLTEIQEF